jgi:signal transduction histidine kinase
MSDRPGQQHPSGAGNDLALRDLMRLIDQVIVLQPQIEMVLEACLSEGRKNAALARRGGDISQVLVRVLDRCDRLPDSPLRDEARGLFRYHHHLLSQTLEFAFSVDAVLHLRAACYFSADLGEPAVRLRRLRHLLAGYLGDLPVTNTLPPEAGHALRTPLTTILGNASSLTQPDVAWSADDEQRLLAGIVDQSHRLARAIDNVLDLAAMQAGSLRPDLDWCDVVEVVRAATATVESAFSRRIDAVADDLPAIRADHRLLTRALVNLADNALRHNPTGTVVSIRATSVERTAGERSVVVSVGDEGRGLPPRIARAVAQLKDGDPLPTEIGTGICTAIGLVRAHGGRIQLDPVGQGTRWAITLPIPA